MQLAHFIYPLGLPLVLDVAILGAPAQHPAGSVALQIANDAKVAAELDALINAHPAVFPHNLNTPAIDVEGDDSQGSVQYLGGSNYQYGGSSSSNSPPPKGDSQYGGSSSSSDPKNP